MDRGENAWPDDIDVEAAISVGARVIEMADRLTVMNALVPGAQANWSFSVDGKRFLVRVVIDHRSEEAPV